MNDRCIRRSRDFQERLSDARIDAVLLTHPDNIAYFAGYWGYLGIEFGRLTAVVLPRDGAPTLITPLMESEMARRMTWIEDVRPWADGEGAEWRDPIGAVLARNGTRHVGIERPSLPPLLRDWLEDVVPADRQADVTPLIAELRIVKDADEIAVMRQAGKVAMAMTEAAENAIAEGVPEYEVALAVIAAGTRKAATFLGEEGPDRFVSPMIHNLQVLQSGHDTCMVHRRSSTRRLRHGDPVYLCYCGIVDFRGYRLGFDREYFVGAATDEQARLYDVAVTAQQAALAALRPGIVAEDVHRAAEAVYREAGLSPGYRTGRGIGCSFLEPPELKPGDRTTLRPGMTFAIDGGITIAGEFGARVGDSVVVTEDGFEYLTPYPRDLCVL